MSVFILEEYKQYLLSCLLSKAVYKKVDITERLLDSLCQFTVAPSTFLDDLPQIVISRKHKQIFNLTDKPRSVQVNDWFLHRFGYKYCTKCNSIKQNTDYKQDASKWNNLQHICAFCANEQSKEYRIQTPEYIKNYQKRNSEQIKKQQKAYRVKNAHKIKEIHKQYYLDNSNKIKEYGTQHRLANLDKYAAKSAKYRANKLKATPKWLTETQLLEIANFYTKSKALEHKTGVKHHVDHIIPLQGSNVCGLHVPWNLQILTAIQNRQKYNKLLDAGDFTMGYNP